MARQPIPKRGIYSADVDTSGMDPDMKDTMLSMRGPGGSSHAGSPPSGTDGFSKFMSGLTGLFKGTPKPKPQTTPQMSSAEEDSLSRKYLGK